ncbi:MAG: hypothetical protein ABL949_12655 [Fimbriimonadaceae bacterium]
MLSTLLLGSLVLNQTPQTLDLVPVGDVWVYPHAPDPAGDPFMRIWGDGAESVDKIVPSGGEFSYGYLVFDIPKKEDGTRFKVTGATLTVFAVSNEELTLNVIKENPLEVRGLEQAFEEKKFHVDSFKVGPYAGVFGKAATAEKVGANYKFTIDLLAKDSEFEEWFNVGAKSGKFALSLTSRISPAESRSLLYKVFTKENDKALVPKLAVKVQ